MVAQMQEEAHRTAAEHAKLMHHLKLEISSERSMITSGNDKKVQTLNEHAAKEATIHLTEQVEKHVVIFKDLKNSVETRNNQLYQLFSEVKKLRETHKILSRDWELASNLESQAAVKV